VAVGIIVRDPQPVGVDCLLKDRGVQLLGEILMLGDVQIERIRIFDGRRGIHQFQRLALGQRLLQLPAPYVGALIIEGDLEEVGIDREGWLRLRLDDRRGRRSAHRGRHFRYRLRGSGRHNGLGRSRQRGLLGGRGRWLRLEEVGREEHDRAHQEEREQQPRFRRHLFGRLSQAAYSRLIRPFRKFRSILRRHRTGSYPPA
jgi:hypothetical protein